MTPALAYSTREAMASLWRGRRAAAVAVLTITTSLFVLGFFLIVNVNLQRAVSRWMEAAELSVFLHDGASQAQLTAIDNAIGASGAATHREYVSRDQAASRFRQDFPDLAPSVARLDGSPFPASFEVRLAPSADEGMLEAFAAQLRSMPAVADVRYDGAWLRRLTRLARIIRAVAVTIVVLLALAAAMTVANAVQLAAAARRDEIDIMQLVGAPNAYVRGPFIAEGLLQGGMGGVLALLLLWIVFVLARRAGAGAIANLGAGSTPGFLPLHLAVALVAGGLLLGCIGGAVVARRVR